MISKSNMSRVIVDTSQWDCIVNTSLNNGIRCTCIKIFYKTNRSCICETSLMLRKTSDWFELVHKSKSRLSPFALSNFCLIWIYISLILKWLFHSISSLSCLINILKLFLLLILRLSNHNTMSTHTTQMKVFEKNKANIQHSTCTKNQLTMKGIEEFKIVFGYSL